MKKKTERDARALIAAELRSIAHDVQWHSLELRGPHGPRLRELADMVERGVADEPHSG